ncbi:MAG: 2-oxoacid:ferredoxin oxidoreductase subunit beta [Legionella sp.]|nr:2-oxoacid:ferredoxin oxidoreductase subunit beta [Legionella sp.]
MAQYKREDFVSAATVRWCPGCGDYAILAALQKLLPTLGLPPEKHVFVSGIGCAGRLPYYMNTFGFHSIHGRAPAVATGLKAIRDDLTVWVITGDGDALSIGGNHLIHCLRRNLNVNILLFNNQVYGLTKGQFSPTSPQGQVTKTSPQGVVQEPLNPLAIALASGASFVARAVDKDPAHLATILRQAYEHPGCSFVEIYQDCHIFNPGAFDAFSIKNHRAEKTVLIKENEPLLFGKDLEWGLKEDEGTLQKIALKSENNEAVEKGLYSHDAQNFLAAMALAKLRFPEFPVPLGVYYQENRPVFKFQAAAKKSEEDLSALFRARSSWNVGQALVRAPKKV